MFLRSFQTLRGTLIRKQGAFSGILFRPLVTIPDKKDAASIMPILDTFENKTAAGFNGLMDQLASNGRSVQAQTVYDRVFRNHEIKANMDTFTHLMVAYMKDEKYMDAMEIYRALRGHEDNSPNTTLKNLTMNTPMYARMIDVLTQAVPDQPAVQELSEPIYEYSVVDNPSPIVANLEGNSSISILTALTLLNDMCYLEIPVTVKIYVSMLQACAKQGDGYVLKKVHRLIRMDPSIEPHLDITKQLLEAYYSVGDATQVMATWNTAESMGEFDAQSIAVALKTCTGTDDVARASHLWKLINDTNLKIETQDFNMYLNCLLRHNYIDLANVSLKEGLAKGMADETSVNIIERITSQKENQQE
ncbi:hypothetical protein BY458DRAFT_511568 [Sporodiniella umbellata]|nr:hypothetical protein BY458DRAFT_511568 [Sporodiniella umbellata]